MTGKDLLLAMSRIDRKYVQEAEFGTPVKRVWGRTRLLVAAILASALMVAGCVAYFLA